MLPTHPPAIDSMKATITAVKDRKGTSLTSIRKSIAASYRVDVEKLGPHVGQTIVHGVEKGFLVCVGNKMKTAWGSFKLGAKIVEHKPNVFKKPKTLKFKKTTTPGSPSLPRSLPNLRPRLLLSLRS
ncbi:Linker histone H1 [Fasciolopsis buskii]|uniref:Linker histone H1 n=1 Tax=Fasciolopsis buskii TaxID=27845 RepID=A0A8E0RLU1_9TREM|nr:Linker histone H1 [Fasciolopsis buski]